MSTRQAPTKALAQPEFIALMAMLAASVAFAIDAMLPAIAEIGAELSPGNLNSAQLIITSFVVGLGAGTFFTGPLSDAYGRRPVMVGGAIIYIAASFAAWLAQSLEIMLIARVVQGLGAAGPRVVAIAMVRDLYGGRDMARIVSFVMVVFSLVPALAPTMGYFIIGSVGWRAIFLAFIVFAGVSMTWLLIRQPETLAPEHRRPLSFKALVAAVAEMFSHPTARLSIIIQTLTFSMLFSMLSSVQQIFDITFDRGDQFHIWFGCIAALASTASLLNARIVGRVGMRAIIKVMYTAQIGISGTLILITLTGGTHGLVFAAYIIWLFGNCVQAGLTIGNLNALAMEEMGHIAGLAASVIAAISTVGAAMIAAPIGLAFNGTALPVGIGALICASLALWLTNQIKRPSDA